MNLEKQTSEAEPLVEAPAGVSEHRGGYYKHLGEVYRLVLRICSSMALSQLSHHLHQVASLGCSFCLDLNLFSSPPPLPRHRRAQGVLLQEKHVDS